MVTKERMEQIESYIAWWSQGLSQSAENRTRLLHFKEIGLSMTDETGADLISDRIMEEDRATQSWHRGLTYAQSLLGRAQAGEDV